MGDWHEKPGSPGDILHYGIKGMRWGHRKQDDGGDGRRSAKETSQYNERKKAFMAVAEDGVIQSPTAAQSKAAMKDAEKKFAAKFEKDSADGSGSGMSAKQKAMLTTVAAYGVTIGAAVGGGYLLKKGLANSALSNVGLKPDDIDALSGKPIAADKFNGLVAYSKVKTWIPPNYFTKESFDRPAFELPAGHEFHRLSTSFEDSFSGATYSTHSLDDFNRYVAGFRHEKGGWSDFQHVSWKSTEPVKVPDLTTVLSEMKSVLKEEGGGVVTNGMATRAYRGMSGGSWDSPQSKKLLKRLREKGYGAIVDEMDAGVIGETPLVFFGHDKATPKKSVPFDESAIKRAEDLLKELRNPPGRKR